MADQIGSAAAFSPSIHIIDPTEPGHADTFNPLFKTLIDNDAYLKDTKVDKVAGKQLSTEDYTTAEKTKLAGVAAGANNYTHPSTHPPSIIAQDSSNRFVTDAEKAAWNAKQGAIGYTPARVASGTYTGNATANRSISVGFQPVHVIVIGNGRKFEALPGVTTMTLESSALDGKNYALNDAVNFGGINATGFALGTAAGSTANVTGQTYTYVAIG